MSIIIFSNCQGPFIYSNWLSKLDFFKKYSLTYFANYDNVTYDIAALNACDIFIYQPTNGFTNVDNGILSHLPTTCIKICFPCVYVDMWCIYQEGPQYIGGECINKYKCEGATLDEILQMFNNNTLNFDLQNRFNNSIKYLQNKETQYCNITVSEFILAHYKTVRLFDTQNHPNGILGSFVATQICKLLNVDAPDICELSQQYISTINGFTWPDSICMKNELGLEFITNNDNNYYINNIKTVYNNPDLIKYKYLLHS
jgi:hypothetical protein